jgi:ABC-type nitrate/sulfonate/bicarbonate transport system ATPase subunit
MRLACRGLSKTYVGERGEVAALDAVELELADGEFVSLVGPSGCGKSTLLNILAGLIPSSSGDIELDGQPAGALLGLLGYMPQKDLLMPWRRVLDNVAVGLELAGTPRPQARTQAAAQFERFGLAGFEESWPASLSGGMRQRAALLRTFLAGRDVMLLDEPFGALDALTRRSMQDWLLEVWAQDRKTILFVSHDVEEALYLSDRVYVMTPRPGRIAMCVEVGLPRPRRIDVIGAPEFVALKQQLLARLMEAVA